MTSLRFSDRANCDDSNDDEHVDGFAVTTYENSTEK
ncbi:hypothetical protein BH18ACI2_BH18ACI2_27860 [soil metagenome]